MKQNRIERSLSRAIEEAPVLPFEELAAAPFIRMEEHDYITRQQSPGKTQIRWRYAFAAVLCILLLTPAGGWFYMNRIPDSTILLDVNPSISISTNHYNKVLSVTGLNDDARGLLRNQDYKDSTIEETVNSLLDSLVGQSYLTTEKNTILLTVVQKNNQKAEELRLRIDAALREGMKARKITPVILSQKIDKESERSRLASQYHTSEGKMKLIQEILSVNHGYSVEELAGMSMEELLHLAKKNSMDLNSYNLQENDANTIKDESGNQDMEQEDMEDDGDRDADEDQDADEQDGEDRNKDSQDAEDRDNQDQNKEDQNKEGQNNEDQNNEDQNNEDQNNEDQGNEDQGNEDQDNEDQNNEDQGNEDQGNEDRSNEDQNKEGHKDSRTGKNSEDSSEDTGEGDQGDNEDSREEPDTISGQNSEQDSFQTDTGEYNQEDSQGDSRIGDSEDDQGASLENNTGAVSNDEDGSETGSDRESGGED